MLFLLYSILIVKKREQNAEQSKGESKTEFMK